MLRFAHAVFLVTIWCRVASGNSETSGNFRGESTQQDRAPEQVGGIRGTVARVDSIYREYFSNLLIPHGGLDNLCNVVPT